MQKTWLFILIVLLAASGCVIYVPVIPEGGSSYDSEYRGTGYREERSWDELDLGYFYDYMEPWGFWVRHASHGYVWIPHSTPYGWRPYTQGKWLWTDYGWTWMSDQPWGWAGFHYGRWDYLSNLGWFWVPGTVWGPSWVAWRLSPSTIGWAPLPPDVRLDSGGGITSLPFVLDDYAWVFVEHSRFYNTGLSRYVLPQERNLTFIRLSELRTHISARQDRVVNIGIDPDDLRSGTRTSITKYQLRQSRKAGKAEARSGELYVYSPRVRSGAPSSPKAVVEDSEVQERVMQRKVQEHRKISLQPVQDEIVELQNQEFKNLTESQKEELKRLDQQARSEKNRAKTRVERERIDKELEDRSTRVQAQHKQEQESIKKRHTEERKKISKSSLGKKKK